MSEEMGLLEQALITLRHARVFITSREKMHPIGVELFDALIAKIEADPHPAQPIREAWECMGRKQAIPEPAECNWPDCGCDPHATKVIESLCEQGWSGPQEPAPMRRAGLDERGAISHKPTTPPKPDGSARTGLNW